jgi:hypothetical protein
MNKFYSGCPAPRIKLKTEINKARIIGWNLGRCSTNWKKTRKLNFAFKIIDRFLLWLKIFWCQSTWKKTFKQFVREVGENEIFLVDLSLIYRFQVAIH